MHISIKNGIRQGIPFLCRDIVCVWAYLQLPRTAKRETEEENLGQQPSARGCHTDLLCLSDSHSVLASYVCVSVCVCVLHPQSPTYLMPPLLTHSLCILILIHLSTHSCCEYLYAVPVCSSPYLVFLVPVFLSVDVLLRPELYKF